MAPADWANREVDMPGWIVVDKPEPGDVAAIPRASGSGHVGFYMSPGIVIAANRNGVGLSSSHFWNNVWSRLAGASGDTVYRRYVGS